MECSKIATGLTVVIDVIRACTTMPILFKNGAVEIIPVRTAEEAEEYAEKGYLPIGEGKAGRERKVFKYNNSPSEVYKKDFSGKKIVFRSNNATQAILNADKATDIILAAFVNIDAVVDYIKKKNTDDITIVPLGRLGHKGPEDEFCAQAIHLQLRGEPYDFEDMKDKINKNKFAKYIKEKLKRPKDISMALELNSYPIIPRVYTRKGKKILKPV
ncbi:MAG: 2-phosphosulfolactate phosphatase [Patescibacteria group bacterium]